MSREAHLILTHHHDETRTFPLHDELLLGRGEDCGIRLNDRAISRHHAVVRRSGESIEIQKKSTFGSLKVNGIECDHRVLKSGDQIHLGPYMVELSFSKATLDPPAPTSAELPVSEELIAPTQIEAQFSPSLDPVEVVPPQLDMQMDSDQAVDFNLTDSPAELEDRTKITPSAQVVARLIFKAGESNHEELAVDRDEITIGRSQECDVVISDKKASRKNTMIRRVGSRYTLIDLDSVNGTILNGVTITTAELGGDDRIQIGDTEFQFKVINHEYEAQKSQLEVIPDEIGDDFHSPQLESDSPLEFAQDSAESLGSSSAGMSGVIGLESVKPQGKGLEERFKALPRRTQVVVVIAAIMFIWWFLDDDSGSKAKPIAPIKKVTVQASGVPNDLSFEKLPADKRKFVEDQHALAFDYYKNKDFDKSIFEIEKIFNIIPDYKDSREIQRYAKEGKRKQESIDEEKRKKEEEEQLKSRVASLVEDARSKMKEKQYEEARELFTQILAIDPDNGPVADWRKDIDAIEEKKKVQIQLDQVKREINAEGWRMYRQGLAQEKSGKYQSSISTLKKIVDIGVTDQKLLQQSHLRIGEDRIKIRKLRDPILAGAKNAEINGDFMGAFKLYQKATRVDSHHPAGYDGMSRIRGALHDQAKVVYTEAVIAENYSDFDAAEKLFKKCLEIAPPDDIYHDRSVRKLTKFVSLQPAPEAAPEPAQVVADPTASVVQPQVQNPPPGGGEQPK